MASFRGIMVPPVAHAPGSPALVVAFIALFAIADPSRGDGGTLRFTETRGGLTISVFTSPTPPCAGVIDVSVLVQSQKTGDAILTGDVVVTARQGEHSVAKRATAEDATNKLMRAAQVELPFAGPWTFDVAITFEGALHGASFHLNVEPASPRWRELIGWIVWPFGLIAVYGLIQGTRAWSQQRERLLVRES